MPELGKRGGVFSEHLVEMLGVVIVLTAIGLALTVFSKVGGEGPTLKANIESVSFSKVCDADLVNFLRAQPSEGQTFAEMVAISTKNPTYLDRFKNETEKFMAENYRRGNNQPGLWRLTIKYPLVEAPLASFGTLETISELDVCSKIVPTLNPSSPLKVELALEY